MISLVLVLVPVISYYFGFSISSITSCNTSITSKVNCSTSVTCASCAIPWFNGCIQMLSKIMCM